MNILPKNFKEFREKDYWDSFFTKRKNGAFEWYGTYVELCSILHKYIKQKDNILVVGCGNSELSANLYDVGIHNITNVDISDIVIKQMTEKHKAKLGMRWLKMDIGQMEFENDHFSVVLDKGTLDAILTDTSDVVLKQVDRIFSEIERVVKFGGRFICISLLQEHILNTLLQWFSNRGWMIRICKRLDEDDSTEGNSRQERIHFPVFVVVCTKLRQIPGAKEILEGAFYNETPKRMSILELKQAIHALQQYSFLRYQISSRNVINEDISFELFVEKSVFPRYTLYIVDRLVKSTNKFAIFIVPQGRETEWLFGSLPGRQQLAENAGFERLIVIHLNRNHHYENLDMIKMELSGKVMELAPCNLRMDTKVPFLSVGNNLGERTVLQKGTSTVSGEFIVEDVEVEPGQIFRRLVFSSSPNVIQSEARLVYEKSNDSKSKKQRKMKKDKKLIIDKTYLACQHHVFMIAGQALIQQFSIEQECRCLILGLGGGGLPSFLHYTFPKMFIDVVELDPCIVEVAKEYYGLATDNRMKVIIADGLEYIGQLQTQIYDIIMVDVDNKDASIGMSCPPTSFVEPQTLDSFRRILKEQGVFVLNLVCRDSSLYSEIMERISKIFPRVYALKIKDEVNEIIYGVNRAVTEEDLSVTKARCNDLNEIVNAKTGTEDFISINDMINMLRLS